MLANEIKNMMPHSPNPNVFDLVKTFNDAKIMEQYGFKPVSKADYAKCLRRVRYFLAQIAHESGELRWTKEFGSGAEYDTGKKAIRLGNTPQADGDGQRYKGRGYIQITGTTNYKAVAKDLHIDCVNHPELLEQPHYALLSALWFWKKNNLNILADKDAFTELTKRINGGTNGMADRLEWLRKANKYINTL